RVLARSVHPRAVEGEDRRHAVAIEIAARDHLKAALPRARSLILKANAPTRPKTEILPTSIHLEEHWPTDQGHLVRRRAARDRRTELQDAHLLEVPDRFDVHLCFGGFGSPLIDAVIGDGE